MAAGRRYVLLPIASKPVLTRCRVPAPAALCVIYARDPRHPASTPHWTIRTSSVAVARFMDADVALRAPQSFTCAIDTARRGVRASLETTRTAAERRCVPLLL